jgi:hypothetical protein
VNHAQREDQSITALPGKTWLFELKSSEVGPTPKSIIPIRQLRVHCFSTIPVLYVLPHPPWIHAPVGTPPIEAQFWRDFPIWSYVIRAESLLHYFSRSRHFNNPDPHLSISIHKYSQASRQDPQNMEPMLTLETFLREVGDCTEPDGWTFRVTADQTNTEVQIFRELPENLDRGDFRRSFKNIWALLASVEIH